MPPKKAKKGTTAVPPAPPPLDGCLIALSGTFDRSQASIEQDINALGGTVAKSVTNSTTHLITTDSDYSKPSAKVKQAKTKDVHIVNIGWLDDCFEQRAKLSEDDYAFGSAATPPVPNVKANGRKRAGDEDDETQPKKKTKAKATDDDSQTNTNGTTNGTNGSAKQAQSLTPVTNPVKKESKALVQSQLKAEVEDGRTNVAKSMAINVQIDETCHLTHYRVYIDSDGIIYDANLNQTNASANNNKFYRCQLLQNNGHYQVWTRWGRVGERGANATLGDGSLNDALRQFDSKFKSKTGLSWANRADNPKANKYTFVERGYGDDSDADEEEGTKDEPAGTKKEEEDVPIPESKLAPEIQGLMELIFNQQYFAATMTDLNYDVNKLPLGKLSKNTIVRGYQALKDLAALLNDPTLAQTQYNTNFQAATESLSNSFYSLIPHAFGRNRPPIIQGDAMLKKEVELLDSLSDMKEASNIMKNKPADLERINVLDQQFKGLNLEEMTPLKHDSKEFSELKNYLVNTKGSTHNANYQVSQIFRIERQGEKERFEKSPHAGPPRNRRLLWHGSRATNFGGILSQGLRIAPPEAPVNGYMFGKGIYLADMSSKSANYCCASISNGHALLLLCEAELGDPMLTLTNASYSAAEDAQAKGMLSTWGQGLVGPSKWKDAADAHPSLKGIKMPDTTVKPGQTNVDNAYLQYNEYITYDIAQVRLRYLLQVRM